MDLVLLKTCAYHPGGGWLYFRAQKSLCVPFSVTRPTAFIIPRKIIKNWELRGKHKHKPEKKPNSKLFKPHTPYTNTNPSWLSHSLSSLHTASFSSCLYFPPPLSLLYLINIYIYKQNHTHNPLALFNTIFSLSLSLSHLGFGLWSSLYSTRSGSRVYPTAFVWSSFLFLSPYFLSPSVCPYALAMAAEKLRDLSQPIDVALLDATVSAFYGTGSKEEVRVSCFFLPTFCYQACLIFHCNWRFWAVRFKLNAASLQHCGLSVWGVL